MGRLVPTTDRYAPASHPPLQSIDEVRPPISRDPNLVRRLALMHSVASSRQALAVLDAQQHMQQGPFPEQTYGQCSETDSESRPESR